MHNTTHHKASHQRTHSTAQHKSAPHSTAQDNTKTQDDKMKERLDKDVDDVKGKLEDEKRSGSATKGTSSSRGEVKEDKNCCVQ